MGLGQRSNLANENKSTDCQQINQASISTSKMFFQTNVCCLLSFLFFDNFEKEK
jgi:hypothetical protein